MSAVRPPRWAFALTALSLLACGTIASAADLLKLEKGSHLCLIGNTLAERMQHEGNLETRIVARHPEHDLVFRNLGFSGDELNLRLRSQAFGSPDEWLSGKSAPPHKGAQPVAENRFENVGTKADVIFAFFGYNESYAGPSGLEGFKKTLEGTLKGMLDKKYNGKSAPTIVLLSPIAFENHKSPNLPTGEKQNANLKLYTEAMAEVAKSVTGVIFVDLFSPTLAAYGKAEKPLTINGVHLNATGDQVVAQIIDEALFGPLDKKLSNLESLRQAINDKNWYWFHRYRTTDGFSNFGGRGSLAFVGGQNNYEVLQRESEVLDQMVANRDKKVWAVAQGKDLEVKDDNTPEFIPVKTNKPGAGPNGTHLFLKAGDESISKMKVAANMTVNLFASEEQFPELVNPVQMAWDPAGRLFVSAWPSYPHWIPKDEMNDKILMLEDTDGDGKADKCHTFADKLHNPTGFEFWNGGVLVAQAPDLLFLKDTNGDGKADVRERVLHGLDTADTHHTSNSFTFDPSGALYFQEGTFHHSQTESAWAPSTRLANGGVFRYDPRAQKFEVYVTYGFANPHGHVFDKWGQDIVVDGTGSDPYHGTLFSGNINFPTKHNRPPVVYNKRTRPCAAVEILSSKHFPEENQGNFLVSNVIGFQGILQYKLKDKDSSIMGTEVEPIVYSTDPNFRPADIEMGPDGAIYFTDWHNPIIGHMQHNLRDPSRDKTHGRVYRVTYNGRDLTKPAKIAGEPIEKLLDLLKDSDDRVRYRARIELSGRNSDEVVAAAQKWIAGLDKSDKEYEHHLTEGLWVHAQHNRVNVELLDIVLASKNPNARAAGTRVLCNWRDRVPDALGRLKKLATDDSGRVRLEAIRTASFFTDPATIEAAYEIPLLTLEKDSDGYLDYLRTETLRTLEPIYKKAKK